MAVRHKFLEPSILSRIGNLELVARTLVNGLYSGIHRSPFFGSSIEFADYRQYAPGDSIRDLDWRVFGRRERLFIKRYEVERNLRCYILLDKSASMGFGSNELAKFQYASYLSASLAYLLVHQRDQVGIVTFDEDLRDLIPPRGGMYHLRLLLHILERSEPGSRTALSEVCHKVAERVGRRALVVLVSDLFEEVEPLLDGLRHFRFNQNEVVVFHILDGRELRLPYKQLSNFEDMESGRQIAVDPNAFRSEYQKRLNSFIDAVRMGCWREQIDYVLCDTSEPLEIALMAYLTRRKEMRKAGR